MSEAKQQAVAMVFQWKAEGFPDMPFLPHDQTNHGEAMGWLCDALQGTEFVRPSGSGGWEIDRENHPHGGRLYNYVLQTAWGNTIKALMENSGGIPPGWQKWSNGCRPLFWRNKHEAACTALGNSATRTSEAASFGAVPWLGKTWPRSVYAPTEAQWLADCRAVVLHHEQYAALRVSLGLPPDVSEPPEPEPDPTLLHLQGGRFVVSATWGKDGRCGVAVPVLLPGALGKAGGLFWFFSEDNPELFVKVVGPVGGRFWVFASALSDADVVLRVEDKRDGVEKVYANGGKFTGMAQDLEAFAA